MPRKPERRKCARQLVALAITVATALTAAETPRPTEPAPPAMITRSDYLGWHDAFLLSNGIVEAVVVPSIGRVMQFRFAGEPDGPFWGNSALCGQTPDPASATWVNFGGDKAWPAPQDDWVPIASRGWPPPRGFDGLPMEAVRDGAAVILVSAVDPNYGIRVRRRIELTPGRPVMTMTTRFEKMSGEPLEIGVWTITQARDPVALYAVLPDAPRPDPAYIRQSDELPASLRIVDNVIALTRDPQKNHKIGALAGTLFWVGQRELLRIDSPLLPGARYPDQGSSVEVYTNADPLAYVELEILGPVEKLAVGGSIERRTTYTLAKRTRNDSAQEIQEMLRP